jgi:hypothetical protein
VKDIIVSFVEDNTKTVVVGILATVAFLFMWIHWDSDYNCNKLPTTVGVLACHLS